MSSDCSLSHIQMFLGVYTIMRLHSISLLSRYLDHCTSSEQGPALGLESQRSLPVAGCVGGTQL